MNTRRKLLLALGAAPLAAALPALTQQPGKIWRVGFLGSTSATAFGFPGRIEALRAGLRELGYVEGRNLVIEFRWAEEKYERLPELAVELVRAKVDVIVTHGNGTREAMKVTTTVPIVMALSADPVSMKIVASLARPGGNVTGMSGINPEVGAKRLELVATAFPRARNVAVLFNPDASSANLSLNVKAMEAAAASLKLELHQFGVKGQGDIDNAFAAMAKKRVDALVLVDDAMITANSGMIASLAAKVRLPAVGSTEFAEAGGLMAYGPNRREMFRRSAYFVDRIFKGAKPGELPIEQPTKFELLINMKTATALGIKLPQTVVVRADGVIE